MIVFDQQRQIRALLEEPDQKFSHEALASAPVWRPGPARYPFKRKGMGGKGPQSCLLEIKVIEVKSLEGTKVVVQTLATFV
jgi:hypothetical protein